MMGTKDWEANKQRSRDVNNPEDKIQIARSRARIALSLNYKNPELRMERLCGDKYLSSWVVTKGIITEAYSNNIFDTSTPIFCYETNKPESGENLIVAYHN